MDLSSEFEEEFCKSFSFKIIDDSKFTIRDYFAGQALAGIMVNIKDDYGDDPHKRIADICYKIADEMLNRRMN